MLHENELVLSSRDNVQASNPTHQQVGIFSDEKQREAHGSIFYVISSCQAILSAALLSSVARLTSLLCQQVSTEGLQEAHRYLMDQGRRLERLAAARDDLTVKVSGHTQPNNHPVGQANKDC